MSNMLRRLIFGHAVAGLVVGGTLVAADDAMAGKKKKGADAPVAEEPAPAAEAPAAEAEPEVAPAEAEAEQLEESERSKKEWSAEAYRLRDEIAKLEKAGQFDGAEMFELLIECGRAAENVNDPAPPFYDLTVRGGKNVVNVCWFRAATIQLDDASLKVDDAAIAETLERYRGWIASGEEPALKGAVSH